MRAEQRGGGRARETERERERVVYRLYYIVDTCIFPVIMTLYQQLTFFMILF